ncbi:MAG: extracellular solute-binding protein [Sphingomonadales bacterium]|nr:extracellular solute-binding protein [Sphingomonadales bacterium]
MQLTRRQTLGWTGALAANLAVGGCYRNSGTIDLWAMGTEAMRLPALMASALPELANRVNVQALPWTAAHSKLLTSFAGGSLPLIGQVGNSWIAEMVALGALRPVPESHSALLADQFPAVVETNRIDGKLYGVPWYVDTRLQFYRKDLLARVGYAAPPPIWEEWKAVGHRLLARGATGGFAVLMPLNENEHLLGMALSAGAGFVRDRASRGDFAAPEFLAALEFYRSLYAEGLAPIASASEVANVWAEFAKGTFAIYPSGPWTVGDMRQRLPDAIKDKWSTAPNPGPNGTGSAPPGGSSLVLYSGHGKREKAGWAVIAGLLGLPAQRALLDITGDLPARRTVWQDAGLIADPIMSAFSTQLDHARPVPKIPEWERIVTEMQVVAERMVRGQYDVKSAAAEMNRRADKLLTKRRWLLETGRMA